MSLLPLQIILGLQVAAAVVIFIQLMAGGGEDDAFSVRKNRYPSAKERPADRFVTDDAR